MSTGNPETDKKVLGGAVIFVVVVLALIAVFCLKATPNGIKVEDGNLVLSTVLGNGPEIPLDEIEIVDMPEGLMKHLFRTNGMSAGSVRYGHFMNEDSGQRLFIYETGDKPLVCFWRDDVIYVVDDWR